MGNSLQSLGTLEDGTNSTFAIFGSGVFIVALGEPSDAVELELA